MIINFKKNKYIHWTYLNIIWTYFYIFILLYIMDSFEYNTLLSKLEKQSIEIYTLKHKNNELERELEKKNKINNILKKKLIVEQDFYKLIDDTKNLWNNIMNVD